MCNACGNLCCGSDEFEGCGCDHCGNSECWSRCDICGDLEGGCACDDDDDYDYELVAKPDFAEQIGKGELFDRFGDFKDWARARTTEMRQGGATWFRASLNEEHGLYLLEGWKARPKAEPEPFFFLTNA